MSRTLPAAADAFSENVSGRTAGAECSFAGFFTSYRLVQPVFWFEGPPLFYLFGLGEELNYDLESLSETIIPADEASLERVPQPHPDDLRGAVPDMLA